MKVFKKINITIQSLSVLAIPLIVLYYGNSLQREINKSQVSTEYLKIAVDILKQPKDSNIDAPVKLWAKKVFISGSPTPLTESNVDALFSSEIVKIKPPVITPCKRYSIQECKPSTNGELFECTLEITKQLNLCADQIDSLKGWQDGR